MRRQKRTRRKAATSSAEQQPQNQDDHNHDSDFVDAIHDAFIAAGTARVRVTPGTYRLSHERPSRRARPWNNGNTTWTTLSLSEPRNWSRRGKGNFASQSICDVSIPYGASPLKGFCLIASTKCHNSGLTFFPWGWARRSSYARRNRI